MNKYTRLFIDESRVYIPDIAAILGRLNSGCPEELDSREGQRLTHSIKGMALYEQQPNIAALTGAMERGFELLSCDEAGGTLVVDLSNALPALSRMIDEVEEYGTPRADMSGIVATLEASITKEAR